MFSNFHDCCQQEMHTPARGIPRSTGTIPSPQPALPLPFVRSSDAKHSLNDIHLTLSDLQATYRPTLAGVLLPSCLIVVSLLGSVQNSGTASVDVYRYTNAIFENSVYNLQ